MPKFQVTSPDGKTYSVNAPEGATQDDAIAYVQREFYGEPKPAAAKSGPPVSGIKSFGMGMMDPIHAGAQTITQVLPDGIVKAGNQFNNWLADKTGVVSRLPDGGIDQQVRERESAYQQERAAAGEGGVDWARLGGNLLSPANLGLAASAPRAATMAGRIAVGSGLGAAGGAMTPVTQGNFAEEKLAQIGTGAAIGGAIPVAAGGLARVVSPKASTNPSIKLLQQEGVQPTIGQTLGGRMNALEERLQSAPIVGDAITMARNRAVDQFNRAALDRVTSPIGVKVTAIGREGVSQAKNALKQAYDDVLPKLSFTADSQFSQDFARIQGMVSAGLPDAERKAFENIIQRQVVGKMTAAGKMSGESFKQVESELSRLAKGYLGDASFDKRQIGSAISEVLSSMRGSLQRTNPQHASQLAKINQGYANFARVRDAAGRIGSEDGVFSPAQLSSAVRAADKSVGKGSFATGNAMMQDLADAGKSTLGQKVPNSFTTDRLLLSGLGLGSGFVNPAIPAGLLGGAGLYTPAAQSALRFLLTARNPSAQSAANQIRNAAPMLAPGGVQLISGLLN